MPPHNFQVPPDTPQRVRHSFDKVIGRLNTRWNLELPSIHGTQETALAQADAVHSLARRCAGQIRYLCFRDCRLDRVISDFEDDVPRICSEWVWKPSQEEGTLPNMPITQSFISTRPALPRKHRQTLLRRLLDLLDEEFKLARESDAYRRTSFTVINDAVGGPQEGESNGRTAVCASRATAPKFTRQQAAGTVVDNIEEGQSKTRRSREGMKRKSSGSEKVRRQKVTYLSPKTGSELTISAYEVNNLREEADETLSNGTLSPYSEGC